MDEILNNLEEISNLLAENKNFSLKDFSPISKLIAETENKVIRLCSSSLQLKEKYTPEFDEWLQYQQKDTKFDKFILNETYLSKDQMFEFWESDKINL